MFTHRRCGARAPARGARGRSGGGPQPRPFVTGEAAPQGNNILDACSARQVASEGGEGGDDRDASLDGSGDVLKSLATTLGEMFAVIAEVWLDDSGTHEGSDVVCLGGFIASHDRWRRLTPEWRGVLDVFGVPYFDSNKLHHFKKPYAGWNEGKRTAFIHQLHEVVHRHMSAPVMSAVDVATHREAARDRETRKIIGSPIGLTMRAILFNVRKWARDRSYSGPVTYFIDGGMKARGEISTLLGRLRKDKEKADAFHVGALVEHSVRERVELQAADMHAYEAYRYATSKDQSRARVSLRALLAPFVQDENLSLYFNGAAIQSYVRRVLDDGYRP